MPVDGFLAQFQLTCPGHSSRWPFKLFSTNRNRRLFLCHGRRRFYK